MKRDTARVTEGSLLFFVLLILLSGFLLVYLGKTRSALPGDLVNLNSASSDEIALTLEIDPALAALLTQRRDHIGGFAYVRQSAILPLFEPSRQKTILDSLKNSRVDPSQCSVRQLSRILNIPPGVARRIVEYRHSLPRNRFSRPDDLVRVPLIDDKILANSLERLIVRSPFEVFWRYLLICLALTVSIFVSAAVLRILRPGGDPYILPFTGLLAGIGFMMMFSIKDPLRDTPVYLHQGIGILLGYAALITGALLSATARRNMRRYTYVWAMAAFTLMLGLFLFGVGPENVRLSLGFFQPIEAVKLLLILFTAGYLTRRADLLADAMHRWRPLAPTIFRGKPISIPIPRREDIGPLLGMYAAAFLLFLIVRDMGPALLLFGVFISMMYLATGRGGITLVGLLLMLLGGLAVWGLHLGVAPIRISMWLSPWSNQYPNGMQLGQALWGFSSGGIMGTGLGLGNPGLMPRAGSDLVFASVGEELGLAGCVTLLVIYCLIVRRGLHIALRAQNDFDRLLAGGLTALLACQVFLITAGVTGLFPLTGITLPFVSWGSSSLIADFLLIGLLRGISSPTFSVPVGAQRPALTAASRRYATSVAIGLLGLVGVGRLFIIQGITGDYTASKGIRTPDADKIVREKINPRLLAMERQIPRGSIYDRRGKTLATSRLDEISRAFDGDPATARRYYRKGRYYPYGEYAAHLVGYLNPEAGGPVGLEREFNSELRGFNTYADLVSDYRSKNLPGWLTGKRPRTGHDLALTIDAELQETAMRLMKGRVGKNSEGKASFVALDPLTGEVLLSCAYPSYDPNTITLAKITRGDTRSNLFDLARYGTYPPGSTIKVAIGGAALEDGINPIYDCNHVAFNLRWNYKGQYYGRKRLQDDRGDAPHNSLKMEKAIPVSCNLYFANLGMLMGTEKLYHALSAPDRFALAHLPDISIFARDLPENSFGQGTMLVTPTEMARIAGAVANQGAMFTPVYWREVRDRDNKVLRKATPVLMSRPLGPENAARMAAMMRDVVIEGTASGVFAGLPVEVAGKTGTTQTLMGNRQPHSWFIGYAPFTRPQWAFACIIENGGYGKRVAAPLCRDVLREIYGK